MKKTVEYRTALSNIKGVFSAKGVIQKNVDKMVAELRKANPEEDNKALYRTVKTDLSKVDGFKAESVRKALNRAGLRMTAAKRGAPPKKTVEQIVDSLWDGFEERFNGQKVDVIRGLAGKAGYRLVKKS